MAGNQDRAERAQARLDAINARLDPMLDKAMAALDAITLEVADALAVQRYVRGVELVAKAARAVTALIAPTPGRGPAAVRDAEDDMNDDDRDDSPETLDRLRGELKSRLDRFHALIEEKRLDCLAGGGWPAPRDGTSVRAA